MTLPGDTSKHREIVFHATPPAQTERAHAPLSQQPHLKGAAPGREIAVGAL